ncbi:MAG: molybdopterin synthase sulfur carrier subunit [Rickettsiales bacterium]|nr:molybdopterin synthase sulfur carrier subunit [Rickettsiales bacterium]|tara:strand:+ start:1196 stop:1495 length:300 start_codon:yes stop_codon:yes gene_type:complete
MSVDIRIPTALRSFTGGEARVSVNGGTVAEALEQLLSEHSGLARHLRDEQGKLRSFVNIYLGDEDIRTREGEQTVLSEGDVLMIVPSIAGGCRLDGAFL